MRPPYVPAGRRRHQVTIETPGTVPDGAGGYVETWIPVTEAPLWAEIVPAGRTSLERYAAGTVTTTASHLVMVPYLAGITTKAAVRFGSRVLHIAGIANPEEANIQLVLLCVEREPEAVS